MINIYNLDNLDNLIERITPTNFLYTVFEIIDVFFNKKQEIKGFTTEELKKLKKSKVRKTHICSICLSQLQRFNKKHIFLPCNHCFHKDCIFEWLKDNNTCPNCKYDLNEFLKKNN
ncbi:hypothetical protein N9T73_00390 [bacterium]|jgi:hypothetical protein|nr:hypothetical protein [bacterium]